VTVGCRTRPLPVLPPVVIRRHYLVTCSVQSSLRSSRAVTWTLRSWWSQSCQLTQHSPNTCTSCHRLLTLQVINHLSHDSWHLTQDEIVKFHARTSELCASTPNQFHLYIELGFMQGNIFVCHMFFLVNTCMLTHIHVSL